MRLSNGPYIKNLIVNRFELNRALEHLSTLHFRRTDGGRMLFLRILPVAGRHVVLILVIHLDTLV